jgi:hypothetical protein
MVVSYDRKTAMAHQYRPNFIAENLGMDCQGQINDYTARLSHILQSGKAVIKTALYYPQRSIFAWGDIGARASASYERLGQMLERAGVSFDIIDEELLRDATVEDGVLCCEHVRYENVFVPEGEVMTFAEMSAEAKNAISHRGRAMTKLAEWFAERV